ncbi:MAG: HAD hydrolase-like protein [Candidatus Gastranaerophilales bacterium]|nr:HAD hydrolase-like protein [Candidatus Gastranaerophilales bacterium]
MKYKAVIFDIDGTLLDGKEGILSSVASTIKYYNLKKLTDSELLSFVGPPIQNSFMKLYGVDKITAQKYADYFRLKYANGDVFRAKVYDEIYKLLELLKQKEYILSVATYKRQDYAADLAKHFNFDKYFDFIFGADNDNKLTKKDIIEIAIKSCNCKSNETIMIGDSCHDGQAANELGIDFIGVTYGFGFKNKDDVLQYNPVLIAQNVNEIIEFFKLNNKQI